MAELLELLVGESQELEMEMIMKEVLTKQTVNGGGGGGDDGHGHGHVESDGCDCNGHCDSCASALDSRRR